MADDDPGYDPLDPLPVTCWGMPDPQQSLERAIRLQRESVALWVWNDDHYENQLLWEKAWVEAEAANPDLVVI
jgi:hypothetical protein